MPLIHPPGLRIKSRQVINAIITGTGAGSTSVTIETVDTACAVIKSMLPGHGVFYGEANVGARFASSGSVIIEWTSNKNSGSNVNVEFEIIEYYKGSFKSLQFVNGGAGTINTVDLNKAELAIASVYACNNQDCSFKHVLAAGSVSKTVLSGSPQTTYAHVFVVETN